MKFQNNKAQVAIFIIVGILILIGTIFFIVSSSNVRSENIDVETSLLSIDVKPVKELVESCIESQIKEGLFKVGPDNLNELENYININLKSCTAEFSQFENLEIEEGLIVAQLEKTEDKNYLIVDVQYPIIIKKNELISNLEDFSIKLPIYNEVILEYENGKTKQDYMMVSPDGRYKLKILKGTSAKINGEENVEKITMEILSSENYKSPYNYLPGNIIYRLEPSAAIFSPPLKVEVSYNDEEVSCNFDENMLKLRYYLGNNGNGLQWVFTYEHKVDTQNNIIYAEVDHFCDQSITQLIENGYGEWVEYKIDCDDFEVNPYDTSSSPLTSDSSDISSNWCLIDQNTGGPCPEGTVNCDCSGDCKGIGTDGSVCDGDFNGGGNGTSVPGKFHHTQTNGHDGGQSLVLCPGDGTMFDSCYSGSVNIPYHGTDDGRISYWNTVAYGREDIICESNGETYGFPVTIGGDGIVYGSC